MIDPLIERRYADCRELIELWRRYHDYFKVAVQGEDLTPEKEHEFITVKSRIAMLHDVFMDSLEHDQNIGQNVLSIVTRSITLKHVRRMSTAEIKKIELEWHEAYLLLNETIGLLEDKRKRFAEVKPSQYYRSMYIKKSKDLTAQFLASWVFKGLVAIVVGIGGFFAFLQLGGPEFLLRYNATRSLVVKFEDLIRLAHKDYPFRALITLERMDALITGGEAKEIVHPSGPEYEPGRGVEQVGQRMGGSANDVSEDLKVATEIRVEAFQPEGMYGGTIARVWFYRMPSTNQAKAIEAKYDAWKSEQAASARLDWVLFRRANVIGVVVGGDDQNIVREWIRMQYQHVRDKR